MAAKITVGREVEQAQPGDAEILLCRGLFPPFIAAMDFLFAQFVHNSDSRRGTQGWSGFTAQGEFIGCTFGRALASVRKNPWLEDDSELFLRFALGALALDGITERPSRCKPYNYGTLAWWRKLGIGAKKAGHGDLVTADLTDESAAVRDHYMDMYRDDYYDIRKTIMTKRIHEVDRTKVVPELGYFSAAVGVNVRLTQNQ